MDPPYLYLRGGQSPPACPTSRWVHACAEGIALVHPCRSPSPGRSWESLPKATRKEEGDGPRCVPPGVQHCVLARCSHQTSRGTHQGQSMLRSRLEQRMGTSRYLPLTQFVPNLQWLPATTAALPPWHYRRWYGPGTAVDIIARCSHRAARRHAENPYVPLTQFVPNLQWLPATTAALPPWHYRRWYGPGTAVDSIGFSACLRAASLCPAPVLGVTAEGNEEGLGRWPTLCTPGCAALRPGPLLPSNIQRYPSGSINAEAAPRAEDGNISLCTVDTVDIADTVVTAVDSIGFCACPRAASLCPGPVSE